MPEPTNDISEELKELITPHLKDHLDPDSWDYIPQMFNQVVYTQPGEVPYVTLYPISDFPAMQFSCITGEFMELTSWEYVQMVDVDAQTAEREHIEMIETITSALQHYHKPDYQIMTDYEKVIENRKELTVNGNILYQYNCPLQTIYLDESNYPISYKNQRVEGDYYYYYFGDDEVDPDVDTDKYSYKVDYEWKRVEDIWH